MPKHGLLTSLVLVSLSVTPARAQACDRTVPLDHPTIQEAIAAAEVGETVCVEAGIYVENIDFGGKPIHLLGLGGAVGTEIDGGNSGATVQFVSGEDGSSVLEGFTITNGYASGGGGFYLGSSSPTLTNLIVVDNMGGYYGGGMYLDHASPTLDHVLFSSNHAGYYVGGMYLDYSSPVLVNVVFDTNHGGYGGGGMYLDYSSAAVASAVFSGNSGGYYGGGMELYHSTATLVNVHLSSNSGGYDGGAIYLGATSPASVDHCNAWSNSPGDYYAVDDPGWDPTGLDGNLSVDPDFLDSHFHLSAASPLVDAGDPSTVDPDGSSSDIGAYGAPAADAWELDGDGFPEWWQPGPYDSQLYLPQGLDCDDRDPGVHPYNGCGCTDADGDGYEDAACGGDDCDDGVPGVNPDAVEVLDGLDNDCDGMVDEGLLAHGALLVTEIMANPSMVGDTEGEWFEVVNGTPYDVNLDGLVVEDLGVDSFTVAGDVWLAAGGHGVLARDGDAAANGGVAVDYTYDGFWLVGAADEIVLSFDGVELDRVEWWDPDWPDAAGTAMSLDAGAHDAALNDDPENWCEAMDPYGLGDLGSPGAANPVCCPDLDADGFGEWACGGDCDDGDPAQFPGAEESCNGEDDDCDGLVDEEGALGCTIYFRDDDGDSFGQSADSTCLCAAIVPYDAVVDGDCNDADSSVFPGAAEICDGQDSDCDGVLPESEADADGDGYAPCGGDCDDSDAGAYPTALEICDQVDNDCDGGVDEGFDLDGDGYTTCAGDCNDTLPIVHPGAQEACDALDNDCDGQTDEGFDLDGDGYTSCAGDCDDLTPTVHPLRRGGLRRAGQQLRRPARRGIRRGRRWFHDLRGGLRRRSRGAL